MIFRCEQSGVGDSNLFRKRNNKPFSYTKANALIKRRVQKIRKTLNDFKTNSASDLGLSSLQIKSLKQKRVKLKKELSFIENCESLIPQSQDDNSSSSDGSSDDSSTPSPTPFPTLPPLPETNTTVKVITPHEPSPEAYAENVAYFAQHIQPILQGTSSLSTETNRCMSCHFSGRPGRLGFKEAAQPYSALDSNIRENYKAFFESGVISLGSRDGSASRVLALLRGIDNYHHGLPGVEHMNAAFVVSPDGVNDPIYQEFQNWIVQKEIPARGALGYYSQKPKFLCWIAREAVDWQAYGERSPEAYARYATGTPPQIYCQTVDNDLNLLGQAQNITPLLSPAITQLYDFELLVSGYKNDTLYTSLRLGGIGLQNRFNVIKIKLEFDQSNPGIITNAAWGYVLSPEYLNKAYVQVRVNDNGQLKTLHADDFVTAVIPNNGEETVIFNSNARAPGQLIPDQPSPTNAFVQDPEIQISSLVDAPDVYRGQQSIVSVQFSGRDGNRERFVQTSEMFTTNATIGPNGKLYTESWFFKYANNHQPWVQQFIPYFNEDPVTGKLYLEGGQTELLPSHLNKSFKYLSSPRAGGKMAADMGKLLVSERQTVQWFYDGEKIVSTDHSLGSKMLEGNTVPDDTTSPARILDAHNANLTGNCDSQSSEGLSRFPTTTGMGFFLVNYTQEQYNPCRRTPTPQNLGIYKATHKGEFSPVLAGTSQLPALGPFQAGAWFPDDHALLIERQKPPVYVREKSDSNYGVVHIPNVWTYLAMKDLKAKGKDQVFEALSAQNSASKITKVRVFRVILPPPGVRQDVDLREFYTRGGEGINLHNATFFSGDMGAASVQLIGDVPVNADGSVAFALPKETPYFMQFLTTINTNKGPIDVAIRQTESMFHVQRNGYDEHFAALNLADYNKSCASCHGASGPAYPGLDALNRLPEEIGGEPIDRSKTLAMENPTIFLLPTEKYVDYLTRVRPILENNKCLNCHGGNAWTLTANGQTVSYDDVNSPGNLNFNPSWHPTATTPQESSRWNYTSPITPTLPNGYRPAPYEPGYVMLQNRYSSSNASRRYLGRTSYPFQGVSTTMSMSSPTRCSIFAYTLGLELPGIECTDGIPKIQSGWNNQTFTGPERPFVRPEDRFGVVAFTDPVTGLPFTHANSVSLDELKDFIMTVEAGWVYRADFKDPAPPWSPFAGHSRIGLTVTEEQ